MKKLFVIYILVFTMVTDPMGVALAQSNGNSIAMQQLSEEFKKHSKGKSAPTVKDLWLSLAENLDDQTRAQLEPIFQKANLEKAPQIRIVPIASQGKESVRYVFKDNMGIEFTVDVLNDGDRLFKVGDQIFKTSDLADIDGFFKRGFKSPRGQFRKYESEKLKRTNYLLTFEEYNKLNQKGKISYFLSLRQILSASHQVMVNFSGKKTSEAETTEKRNYVLNLIDLFIDDLNAQDGRPCVVAGFPSVYGRYQGQRTCLYETGPIANLLTHVRPQVSGSNLNFSQVCEGGTVPCNPNVFGYREGSKPYCVQRFPRSEFQVATNRCDTASPLASEADTIRLIRQIQRAEGNSNIDSFFENDRVKQGKFNEVAAFANSIMESHQAAIASCTQNVPENPGYDVQQPPACETLNRRITQLNQWITHWRGQGGGAGGGGVLTDPSCREQTTAGGGGAATRPPASTEPPNPTEREQGAPGVAGGAAATTANRDGCGTVVGVGTGTGGQANACTSTFWECNKDWLKPVLIGLAVVGGLVAICLIGKIGPCKKKKKPTPVIETPVPPEDKPKDPTPDPQPQPDPQPPQGEGQGTNQTTGNSGTIRGSSSNPSTIRQSTGKQ